MTRYAITPEPKPRMTRRDKWAKRTPVVRYRAYCDGLRMLNVELPVCGAHITFRVPMPKSWSKKKKAAHEGQPMQQTPDKDNLEKALMDCLLKQDSVVWDSRVRKLWDYEGSVEIDVRECWH